MQSYVFGGITRSTFLFA